MLKITKGLKPFVEPRIDNDDSKGIHTYTDDEGNEYVRVKIYDEDFCITAHDYARDGKEKFTWNEAMKSLKADDLTTFTKEQAELYKAHYNEISSKLKEIDGDILKENSWYWTSTEHNNISAWVYYGSSGSGYDTSRKSSSHRVRPILDLTDK